MRDYRQVNKAVNKTIKFYRVRLKDLLGEMHTLAWYSTRREARERLYWSKSLAGSLTKVWIDQVKTVDGVRCIKVVR